MNIDTVQGMEQAKEWLENLVTKVADGGIWGIPRSGAFYRIDKKTKTVVATLANRDVDTERVFTELGWKIK